MEERDLKKMSVHVVLDSEGNADRTEGSNAVLRSNLRQVVRTTIDAALNPLEPVLNNGGGTYQSCQFHSVYNALMAVVRWQVLTGLNLRQILFWDTGAGQNRICWYASAILGCKAVGTEIEPDRVLIGAQSGLELLANANQNLLLSTKVALLHRDAKKALDLRTKQNQGILVWNWNVAFNEEVDIGIFESIAWTLNKAPDSKIVMLISLRHRSRVEHLLQEYANVLSWGPKCTLAYKSGSSGSLCQWLLLGPKDGGKKPSFDSSTPPSLERLASVFFNNPDSSMKAYRTLRATLEPESGGQQRRRRRRRSHSSG